MADEQVVVIGAGIGGLAAAIDLAALGFSVTVIERAARAGGKMREVEVGGAQIDSGPTVFTMRWVFDELFESAGATFESHVPLSRLQTLARHAWSETEQFDLFADAEHAADAVAAFSGPDDGRRFSAFCKEARAIYLTLKDSFLRAPRPNPLTLAARIGFHRPAELFGIRPFDTMWDALSRSFHDPRLRQLFGRYATYNGSSPFAAPATLMLIAHVEQDGVWTVDGGMQRLAEGLERLARARGARFRFDEEVAQIIVEDGRVNGVALVSGERMRADAVVLNADVAALAEGLFGNAASRAANKIAIRDRSLSALTWAMTAEVRGMALLRHNVFFSQDYRAEFEDIFRHHRLPQSPTIYVCAQDRGDTGQATGDERLLMLVNAPAVGDRRKFAQEEIASCENHVFRLLERCGLSVRARTARVTTPTDFHRLFPATGGALYGRASHGWAASFRRPASATKIAGLYLAGGSTHPGAGMPMAALSGRLAAQRLVSDRVSMQTSRRAAIFGGISTGSAKTDAMRLR